MLALKCYSRLRCRKTLGLFVEGEREKQFVHCFVHHNEEFHGHLLEYEEYQMAKIVIAFQPAASEEKL